MGATPGLTEREVDADDTRRYWPVVGSLLLLALVTCIALFQMLSSTGGRLIYVLDDTYISMAIAKHFAELGVWGVTPYEFTSASSSPLWPLLLAATYRLVGTNEQAPWLLNFGFCVLLVCFIAWALRRELVNSWLIGAVIAVVVISAPMHTLVFVGLEHSAHALLTVVFAYQASIVLDRSATTSWLFSLPSWLVTAALLCGTRYEAVALVAVVAGLLLLRGAWLMALAVMIAGAAPLVIYGAISVYHGNYWIPNPLLLKTDLLKAEDVGLGLGLAVSLVQRLVVNVLLGAHLVALLLALFLCATVFHLAFARMGYFYRYEAYLVVLGLFSLGLWSSEIWHQVVLRGMTIRELTTRHLPAGLLLVVCACVSLRGAAILVRGEVGKAAQNIYEQQYQTGLFLNAHYSGEAVALNDIGAANFLADLRCLDLLGLASVDVTTAMLEQEMTAERSTDIVRARGVRIVLVNPYYLPGLHPLPNGLVRSGVWRLPSAFVVADDEVVFYGTSEAEAARLRRNLQEFERRLPAGVMSGA